MKLLDCTLRDGGYYNNWDFSNELVQEYITAMESLKVDFIELGFRFTSKPSFLGGCAYTTDNYINSFKISADTKIGIMLNASDFLNQDEETNIVLNRVFPNNADNSPVHLVRIACHFADLEKALGMSEWLKEQGFLVGFNIMQIGERNFEEIETASKIAANYPIDVLYFADSLGNIDPKKTKKIINAIRKGWKGEIGIHTHDNMGNAIANTLSAIEEGVTWIDSTVTGMGRGPGNAQTELLAIAAKSYLKSSGNVIPLLKIIREYFEPLKKRYGWGKNPYYYLAGEYGIHPSYIQQMLDDNRYGEEDLIAVIDYLKKNDSKSYRVNKLDIARKIYHNSPIGLWCPKEVFENKKVLILGTGPGVKKHKEAITAYIKKYSPIVLALNAKKDISDDLIDYRVACHPIRLLADIKEHLEHEQPIIMPQSMLEDSIINDFLGKKIYDFGLKSVSNKFEFNESHCVVPKTLVAAYALAVVNSGNASEISMAGFDGYGAGDVRQKESEDIFKCYLQTKGAISITSITNTSYKIPVTSVYSFL